VNEQHVRVEGEGESNAEGFRAPGKEVDYEIRIHTGGVEINDEGARQILFHHFLHTHLQTMQATIETLGRVYEANREVFGHIERAAYLIRTGKTRFAFRPPGMPAPSEEELDCGRIGNEPDRQEDLDWYERNYQQEPVVDRPIMLNKNPSALYPGYRLQDAPPSPEAVEKSIAERPYTDLFVDSPEAAESKVAERLEEVRSKGGEIERIAREEAGEVNSE
jgi:hypothetical protein